MLRIGKSQYVVQRSYGKTIQLNYRRTIDGLAHVLHATEADKSGPDREAMERRAYELYLARGGADGDAAEDWFMAEQDLQSKQPEM